MTTVLTRTEGYSILLGSLAVLGIGAAASSRWIRSQPGKSFGPVVIGLSYFGAGMGGWVLSLAPGVGAEFGILGLLGYATVCCIPLVLMMYLGPRIQTAMDGNDAYALTDWVRVRFGLKLQIYVSFVSMAYMSIFMCAELSIFADAFAQFADLPRPHSVASLVALTTAVSSIGGLSTSILAHAFQGCICVVLLVAALALSRIKGDEQAIQRRSEPTWQSVVAVASLLFAVTGAELLNMTEWQRVWSAKDHKSLKRGLFLASVLVFATVTSLGVLGLMSDGDPQSVFVVSMEDQGLGGSLLALSTFLILCTSTVDALQQGIVSLLSRHLKQRDKWFRVAAFIIVNASTALAACVLSIPLMQMFMIANLLATCAAVPVFLGLRRTVTSMGVGCGCVSALVTVFIHGLIEQKTFLGGLEQFALPSGPCSLTTLTLFACATFVAALVTLGVSRLTYFPTK